MSDTNGQSSHHSTTVLTHSQTFEIDSFEDEYENSVNHVEDYTADQSPTGSDKGYENKTIKPEDNLPIELLVEEEEEGPSLNPQDYQPRQTLVDHALAKPIFLGGAGLVIVLIAGIFLNHIMGSDSSRNTTVPSPAPSETPAAAETPVTGQEGELKSQLAFAGQTVQNHQALRPTRAVPAPETTPASEPAPSPVPEAFTSQVPEGVIAQTSVPMPPPVLPPEAAPAVQPEPSQPSFQELYAQMSPVERWQIAAQSGSFGSISATPHAQRQPEPSSLPFPQTRQGNLPLVENPPPAPVTQSSENRGTVLVGTKADATIETAIALASDNSVPNELRYLIRLTSPLKDTANRTVIPAGSVLVTTVRNFSPQTGTVQLTAQSFIQNNQEKPLPANSVLIRAANGGTLTARREGGGNQMGRSLLPALFSGISQAAQTINEPRSSITVNGGSTITSNNGNRNIGAAFAGGAFRNLTEQLQQQAQTAQQQAQSSSGHIWRIAEGQTVQVFVNSSFSL